MSGNPLENGIRDHDVSIRIGGDPLRDIAQLEGQPAGLLLGGLLPEGLCFAEHFLRGVQTHNARLRPAINQRSGQVPGTAAEVNDCPWFVSPDPRDEVMEWPVAMVAEFHILGWIPLHKSLLASAMPAGPSLNRPGTKLETNETS